MKTIVLTLLLIGCATVNPYAYNNVADQCPHPLTEEQRLSGAVQCRGICASFARNMVEFDSDCRCVCSRPINQSPQSKPATPGQTSNTQI